MPINFPSSGLVDGQLFNAPNGITYMWNATAGIWTAAGGSSSSATISATPPANPFPGQIWWSPDYGRGFIFFVDASGPPGQWVPFDPSLTPPAGTLALYNEQVLTVAASEMRVTIPAQPRLVQLEFGVSSVNGANDSASLQMLQGSTPLTTAAHDYMQIYENTSTAFGAGASNLAYWILTGGIFASGWWKSSSFNSSGSAVPIGTAQVMEVQTGGIRMLRQWGTYFNTAIPGGYSSITGFRLFTATANNFSAGSYLRSFVVQ